MKITQTKTKGLSHSFKIVVSVEEFSTETAKRLGSIASQAKLPGFRPGKAPLNVIEQKYGQAVRSETAEHFIQQGIQKALEDNKLRSATNPKVDVTTFENNKDFEFTVDAEVLPEIKPIDFSKIEIQKLTAEVTDKEINDALNRLALSRRETEVVNEKRKTQKGDIIVIDFVGSMNGKEFRGGKGSDYYLELGSNTFIPGFEEQLTGINVPGKATVNVTFPKNYHAKEMAGKDAVFDVTIKELRKIKNPEINDDFAKAFGKDSLDALKELVKEELTKEYDKVSNIHLKRALLDALEEKSDFEAPVTLVDMEFNAIWKQFEEAKKQGTIDEEEKNTPEEKLKKDYKAIAERRVKLGLLLAEIANENNITLSQKDVSNALATEARRYPGQEKKVLEFYSKNQRALEALKAPLFEEKVIAFITDKVKLNLKKLSVEELYAYDPDQKKTKKTK